VSASTTSVTLGWNPSSDNVGVSGYGRYRGGSLLSSGAGTSFTFGGLTCGTAYVLGVDAYDAAGNRSAVANVTVNTAVCADTSPPSSPTGLVASAVATTSVSLRWNPSSDNVGVAGYGVYNGVVRVGTATGTSYTVGNLLCGKVYSFGVDAYDGAGNRSSIATVTVSTAVCPIVDISPPSAPTGLSVSSVTSSSVAISWSPSTDDVGVAGYDRYRGGTLVSSGPGTSYTFTGLSCGTSYTFAVDAYDAAGNLSRQTTITGATSACAVSGSGAATIAVSTGGNDSTCVRGNLGLPCASLNRAYSLSQCGDTVQVAAGSYPDQYIRETAVGSACSTPIVFQPAAGTQPTINWVAFGSYSGSPVGDGADNVVLRGFRIPRGVVMWGDVNNITLDGIDGGSFYIQGASNIRIRNSDWGPCSPGGTQGDCRTYYQADAASGQPRIMSVNGLLVEHSTFHDMTPADKPGQHWECVLIAGGTDVTWRGDKFSNCSTNALAIGDWTAPISNWTIEDNWFGDCPGGNSSGAGPYCLNVTGVPFAGPMVIRNNSFAAGEYAGNEGGGSDSGTVSVTGNIFGGGGAACIAGASYNYNLWLNDSGCGSGKGTLLSLPFVNVSGTLAMDYHLALPSLADGFVKSGCAPADFDGAARSAPCDAGADER